MKHGDLSNEVVPRIVIVFEGLLGFLPSKPAEAKFATYVRFKRWKKAAGLFEINEPVARQIWDWTWRSKFSVDVVTHLGSDQFAEALQGWIDKHDLPVGHVWFETSDNLARSLAFRPTVACVIHADPHHQFTFGGRGRYLAPGASLNGVI